MRAVVEAVKDAEQYAIYNATDIRGNTALHVAAAQPNSLKVMQELSVISSSAANSNGLTPFLVAMFHGRGVSVKQVIDVLGRPDEKTIDLALRICAGQGHWHMTEELIKMGADLSDEDKDGNTALHIVVKESVDKPKKLDQYLQVK